MSLKYNLPQVKSVIFAEFEYYIPDATITLLNSLTAQIGSNVCISQRSIICSGGHDYRSASLQYSHKPIEIKDGAWICLDAKILPGVTIGECSVVSAGEIARKSVPDYSMLVGGEIRQINPPK